MIGRTGSIVYVELSEHDFWHTCEMSEVWRLRKRLRESDLPVSVKLDCFRVLEQEEARFEQELDDLDFEVDNGGSVFFWSVVAALIIVSFFLNF